MVSYMIGSLFILLMFSLAVWKLFILMKSHLFILSFSPQETGSCFLAGSHCTLKVKANYSIAHGYHHIF